MSNLDAYSFHDYAAARNMMAVEKEARIAELEADVERLRAALDESERQNEELRSLNVTLTNAAERALGVTEVE